MLGRVDVQRAVGAAVPVGVAERPVATDPVGGLEGGVRNAVVLQHLARGQSTDARTDDRGARVSFDPLPLLWGVPDSISGFDVRQ